jgi:hypothetical protein
MPPSARPNFLHLGPGKSGSTWLHEVLIGHPEVFLTKAKDLYYFSRYFERGTSWYASHFRDATAQQHIVGEVCPDYLVSPLAAERIHSTLGPSLQLMVTLRDPVERAFSSHLYLAKHGLAEATFRETLKAHPELLNEGRYGTLLQRYLQYFDKSQLLVATFDDLEADPQRFLNSVTNYLGIASMELDEELRQPRLPASAARFPRLAAFAQATADWVRRHDGAQVVGAVKRSAVVQRALYRPLGADRPHVSDEDAAFVRRELSGEIATVDQLFGLRLQKLWGWQ